MRLAASKVETKNEKRNRVESTRVVTFKSPFAERSQIACNMVASTLFPTCSLFLSLSLSLSLAPSLSRSHLRFGSCQHLEKLKVAVSAAHKFEAALVFKVSCSAETGEKMHMQMQ